MKSIKNKTPKPLSVPLPGGKRLFLGPGKSGQIADKAVDHPPLAALIEAGDVEVLLDGAGQSRRGGGNTPSGSSVKDAPTGKPIFRAGDG